MKLISFKGSRGGSEGYNPINSGPVLIQNMSAVLIQKGDSQSDLECRFECDCERRGRERGASKEANAREGE